MLYLKIIKYRFSCTAVELTTDGNERSGIDSAPKGMTRVRDRGHYNEWVVGGFTNWKKWSVDGKLTPVGMNSGK